jgi:hypothetical protein
MLATSPLPAACPGEFSARPLSESFSSAGAQPGPAGQPLHRGRPAHRNNKPGQGLSGSSSDLFLETEGDPFFLGRHADAGPDEVRERFERAYFRTLQPEHRVIAEGSVSYLYDRRAIERILRFDPDARLVVGLRNPLALLPSYHARLLYTMDEDVADFARAWALQDRRRRGEAIPARCREPRLLLYREVGRLGRHLRRLIEVTGRERCFPILFDDFGADPLGMYRRLLAFAGLPDDGRTELRRKNERRTYRHAWLQPLVMNPPDPIARLAGLLSETGHARLRALVRPLRRKLKKINMRPAARAALPIELRRELSDYFRQDVAELGRLLRRDLSGWLEPRA